jgi:hypothetical protein
MGAAVWACGAVPLWAMTRAASIPGVWWIVVAAVLLVLVAALVVNAGHHRRSHAPMSSGEALPGRSAGRTMKLLLQQSQGSDTL